MSGCEHAYDDGAYVLGALPPAERFAYESHLATCPSCQRSVHDLAALPGLLGRIDTHTVLEAAPRAEPGYQLAAVVGAVRTARRRERRVRRWRYAVTAFAAACVAVVVTLAGVLPRVGEPATDPKPALVAMRPVAGEAPVTADVGIQRNGWGTEVTMRCSYAAADYAKPYPFRLVAYGRDGSVEQIGSWLAGPGDTVRLTGATRLTDNLVRLELTRADGTPLLAYDVP